MFTPEEAENIIIGYLNQSAEIQTLQSGKGAITRKDGRAENTTRDITVSTISLTDGDVQLGMHSVTIWVKDLTVSGVKVRHVIDQTTIDSFVKAIVDVLGGQTGKFWANGNIYVANTSSAFVNAETKEHFVTVRVRSRLHNKTEL